MSREIEFRAWHEDAKEYCEGSVSNMCKWVEDGQPVLLEQFTGLLDCNGVKIFEGDIVILSDGECSSFGTVEFSYAGYVILINHAGVVNLCDLSDDEYELMVAGNIHQNHELLA